MRRSHLLAIAIALIPLSAAFAAEFTFTVPIEMQNIPSAVKAYGARCTTATMPITIQGWKAVGVGNAGPYPLAPGQTSLKTSVTMAFDHAPNLASSAGLAKAYECAVIVCTSTDPNTCRQAVMPGTPPAVNAPAWSVAAPGAILSVSGTLP